MTFFLVVSTSMTLNDLKPQNRVFSDFLAILGCGRWMEIDQDYLRAETAIGFRVSH